MCRGFGETGFAGQVSGDVAANTSNHKPILDADHYLTSGILTI
jgi:hypothetical protein